MKARLISAALVAAAGVAASAAGQSYESYVSLSAGAIFPDDSEVAGAFAAPFTTGEGGAIPAGTLLDTGTAIGWSTDLDTGYLIAGALGASTASGWRGELEVAYASSGVDQHTGATIDGVPIGGADAGLFFPGSAATGQSVDALLADGSGSLDATYLMLNAYFDFGSPGWLLRPYAGGGLGAAFVDVDFSPQGVSIAQDEDNVFAYQLIGGATLAAFDRMELFGQGRFRASDDIRVRNAADIGIPLALDLENRDYALEAGVRFKF